MLRLTWLLLLVFALSGCAGYSMHSMCDVTIQVSDNKTEMPIGNVEVSVKYDYDSYGMFYFANKPEPVSGVTDANGKVVLTLADFRYRILMWVAGKPAQLSKELVQKGGTLKVPSKEPVYTVVLSPM